MPTHTVNTHEAKSRLSELIRKAAAGDDVIVSRNGQPVAKIVPWPPPRAKRVLGSWEGRIHGNLDSLVESDPDVVATFDESARKSL